MTTRTTRRVFVVGSASGAVLSACATPRPAPAPRLSRLRPTVTVSAPARRPDAADFVAAHLDAALSAIAGHGLSAPRPVLIAVHDTVDEFVAATGQTAPWMRAYAQYARVDFLAPRFWSDPGQHARREKLTHELWHVSTFQCFGTREHAVQAHLPFWLREGSASVVAGQVRRRAPLARVRGLDDALRAPPTDHRLRYAAAHHTCAHLVQRHGDDVFARLFAATGDAVRGRDPHPLSRALEGVLSTSEKELWREVVERSPNRAKIRQPQPSWLVRY